jgi:hypothetical protein
MADEVLRLKKVCKAVDLREQCNSTVRRHHAVTLLPTTFTAGEDETYPFGL